MPIKYILAIALVTSIATSLVKYALGPDSAQLEANTQFVRLMKTDHGPFSLDVETAVGECADLRDISDDTASRVRRIAAKIVEKIMYWKSENFHDDGNTARNWLKEELKKELNSSTDTQFDVLIKSTGKIIGSTKSIKCIIRKSIERSKNENI